MISDTFVFRLAVAAQTGWVYGRRVKGDSIQLVPI